MSADESALLAAVAADPADDLPRLVYADWLDDHSHAVRAEFVRLQCRIAGLADVPQWQRERSVHLWMRQQELLDHHRAELVGDLADLPDNPVDVVWERGFLAEVTLSVDVFLDLADRLDARVPPPRVTVAHVADRLDEFLGSALLGCVTGVSVLAPGAAAADRLPLDARVGRVATTLGRLHRLATLDLGFCELTDDDVPTLVPPGSFPALRELDLSWNSLSDAGVVALLNTGLPRRLVRLALTGNHLFDPAAYELADRLGRVVPFRTLDIRNVGFTNAGQLALTSAFGSRCNLF